MRVSGERLEAVEATISAVYRHACNDAVAAAASQDWAECRRLSDIARSIAVAYPEETSRARFPQS